MDPKFQGPEFGQKITASFWLVFGAGVSMARNISPHQTYTPKKCMNSNFRRVIKYGAQRRMYDTTFEFLNNFQNRFNLKNATLFILEALEKI